MRVQGNRRIILLIADAPSLKILPPPPPPRPSIPFGKNKRSRKFSLGSAEEVRVKPNLNLDRSPL